MPKNYTVGDVVTIDVSGSHLETVNGHTLAVIGVDDLAVIDTGKAVMIAPRDRLDEVVALVETKPEKVGPARRIFRWLCCHIGLHDDEPGICKTWVCQRCGRIDT